MADLSTVLNLNGMTEVLRNFSAPCLNQPVKMLPLGPSTFLLLRLLPALTWPPLCWNMTCKYQSLARVTSPNTAHWRADASGKCLSLATECPTSTVSPLHLTCLESWALLRPNGFIFLFFFFWTLPVLLCACVKANERLYPDVGVKLHSWANSRCLLYSMTCLKWHAGPKRRGPAEFWRAEPAKHSSHDKVQHPLSFSWTYENTENEY